MRDVMPRRPAGDAADGKGEDGEGDGEGDDADDDRPRVMLVLVGTTSSLAGGAGSRRMRDPGTRGAPRLTDCFPVLSGAAMATEYQSSG